MSAGSRFYAFQYEWRQRLAGASYGLRRRLLPRTTQAAPPSEPSRVLVVLTGLLGDTVMSTPLVVEARRLWPAAHVTLLGRRQNCELLRACPLVDELVEAPAIPFSLRRRRELRQLDEWLRAAKFDVALIALGDQFAAALAKAGIPVRVGVEGHALGPCLTHTYSIGSPREWGPDERLNALRSLGYEVGPTAPRLWVSDEAREAAQRRLAELGLAHGTRYAVAHPFGSTPRQWWPVARVVELSKTLRARHGLTTVLVGGPETRGALDTARETITGRGETVGAGLVPARGCGGLNAKSDETQRAGTSPAPTDINRVDVLKQTLSDKRADSNEARGTVDEGGADSNVKTLIDATGVFDVPQLLAVIEGAEVVVTTDSGPFHIAGALGRPLVGLFRARRPEHAGRYASARVLLGRDERCARECEWDRCGAEPCRQMNALGVAEAAGAVGEILGA